MENQHGGCPPGKAWNYLYLSIGLTYMQNANGYVYIFEYMEPNALTVGNVRRRPMPINSKWRLSTQSWYLCVTKTQLWRVIAYTFTCKNINFIATYKQCMSDPDKQCTSGLQTAILNSGSWPMSDNVGSTTGVSSMVENVGVAVGISLTRLTATRDWARRTLNCLHNCHCLGLT